MIKAKRKPLDKDFPFSELPQNLFFDHAALFDTSFLAGEAAEVVKFSATYLTVFVYGNRVDEGRLDGEDTLNTDVFAHLANGETFLYLRRRCG